MDSTRFPQLAFDFDELINGSFVQQIFSSSSFSKAESLLLEFILENDQLPKESPALYENQMDQKENDPSLQQQKIHQLKTKLILSLQGSSSSPSSAATSSSSSLSLSEDQNDEDDQCWIECQGLIEKVFSFKQRLKDFSSDSVSSVLQSPKPKKRKSTTQVEENHETCRFPFDNWSDSDCQLLLEEIGTRRNIIQSIQNRIQREEKSLYEFLLSIHQSLENPSAWGSVYQEELPELSKEEMSRLLIGLDMLSLGFGIVQIPQWWIDQEQEKPMEEKNLMSINSGSEQVAQWLERNLFPSIEPQLNEQDKEEIISSIKSNKCFSGCQIFFFLDDFLPYWRYESGDKRLLLIEEAMMAEQQRLFEDLEKQLVIMGNSDYDPEKEDQNIHFFDPLSRMQRKLSNQVGTWISSPPPSVPSSWSFGFQTTTESASESLLPFAVAMGLKIRSIMDEINEIKKQHECKEEQQKEESNQKRIQNNLPPRNEGALDILRSFLRKQTVGIRQLIKENVKRIPEEIKYLSHKDLDLIELDQFFFFIYEEYGKKRPRELQSLDRCSKITELNLGKNQIVWIPAEISQLKNLKHLELYRNFLTSIPAEIGQLTNLETLELYRNQLTSIPAEIGQLKNLINLYLWENQLESIPTEIGQLMNLKTLELHQNRLISIPAEIGQLTNLETLYLGFYEDDINCRNRLKSIPAEIGQLTNLKTLDLSKNWLTSIPVEIGQLTNLETLHLSKNRLTSIPAEIGQLKNLTSLYILENRLTSIPAEIGQLTNLKTLDLCQNWFTSIPAEIGQLKNLIALYLGYHGHQISSLPAKISQLTNLQTLCLQNNQKVLP